MLSSSGTAIAASTASERNRQSSSSVTSTPDAIEHSRTSDRMLAAASRANTAGPEASSRTGPGLAAAKAARMAASAASCAPMSMPGAAVCSSSSARSRSGANHTPSTLRTEEDAIQAGAMASSAPVGSGRPNCTASGEASDCNCDTSRAKSACSASVVKACGVVAGESRYRCAARVCSSGPSSVCWPLLTRVKRGFLPRASAMAVLMRARSAGGAPSMPARMRLDAVPPSSWRSMNRLASVRPAGRKAAMSVRTSTMRKASAVMAAAMRTASRRGRRFKGGAAPPPPAPPTRGGGKTMFSRLRGDGQGVRVAVGRERLDGA